MTRVQYRLDLKLAKDANTSASRSSYGVSFVCSLGKYDPNMSRMHFSLFLISGFNDGVDLVIITM